nr:hypothetical protein [Tanacetum cinerariifolium]
MGQMGSKDNKDVALKSERRRIDDIIDYIRDKYGWSEEITWPDAKWRLIDADVSRTLSIKPYFEQVQTNLQNWLKMTRKMKLRMTNIKKKKMTTMKKEQDDNDGLDDETWTPKKEATSSSRRAKKKKVVKRGEPTLTKSHGLCINFRVRKEDDKKDVNENKAQVNKGKRKMVD